MKILDILDLSRSGRNMKQTVTTVLIALSVFAAHNPGIAFAAEKELIAVEGEGISGLDVKKHKPEDVEKFLGPVINRLTTSPNSDTGFYKNGARVAINRSTSRLHTIMLTEFFPGKTSKGIRIGSPKDAVTAAYGKGRSTKDSLTYNDAGVGFTFVNDHVRLITIFPKGGFDDLKRKIPVKKAKQDGPGQFLFDMKGQTKTK